MSLDQLLSPTQVGEGRFTQEIPDGWQQGRGAFGGLVLGNLVRAMGEVVADGARGLRSLTGELCGPVLPGACEITVEALRIGSAVSTLRATLRQDGQVQATAVGVFGAARARAEQPVARVAAPASVSSLAWRDAAVAPLVSPPGPAFIQHFEIRPVGPLPLSGSREQPFAGGWARPVVACQRRDDAYLVAQADVWWPAYLTTLTEPRPMATIAFTYQSTLSTAAALAAISSDEPLYHHGEVLAASDGYIVEQRQLRAATGQLLALNQQTFVLIK